MTMQHPNQGNHITPTSLPDSAFTPEELAQIKALVLVRDEAWKASKIAALKIKGIENAVKLRLVEQS